MGRHWRFDFLHRASSVRIFFCDEDWTSKPKETRTGSKVRVKFPNIYGRMSYQGIYTVLVI